MPHNHTKSFVELINTLGKKKMAVITDGIPTKESI